MTKREQKLNRIWNYLQKTASKEDLEGLNLRAFLYSVGRLSYEQCLVELVAFYFGKVPMDEEVKAIVEIMEGTK